MDEEARADGSPPERRQFLIVIDVEIIRRAKILAIERGITASTLVQQALADFLRRETAISTRQGM